jgi:hypothetical protein
MSLQLKTRTVRLIRKIIKKAALKSQRTQERQVSNKRVNQNLSKQQKGPNPLKNNKTNLTKWANLT